MICNTNPCNTLYHTQVVDYYMTLSFYSLDLKCVIISCIWVYYFILLSCCLYSCYKYVLFLRVPWLWIEGPLSIGLLLVIFASQGLRSALLIFTLGIVRRIFVIPTHCHLLDFVSHAPCNDVIFSQSTRGFHFLLFECPEN